MIKTIDELIQEVRSLFDERITEIGEEEKVGFLTNTEIEVWLENAKNELARTIIDYEESYLGTSTEYLIKKDCELYKLPEDCLKVKMIQPEKSSYPYDIIDITEKSYKRGVYFWGDSFGIVPKPTTDFKVTMYYIGDLKSVQRTEIYSTKNLSTLNKPLIKTGTLAQIIYLDETKDISRITIDKIQYNGENLAQTIEIWLGRVDKNGYPTDERILTGILSPLISTKTMVQLIWDLEIPVTLEGKQEYYIGISTVDEYKYLVTAEIEANQLYYYDDVANQWKTQSLVINDMDYDIISLIYTLYEEKDIIKNPLIATAMVMYALKRAFEKDKKIDFAMFYANEFLRLKREIIASLKRYSQVRRVQKYEEDII